jgi:hypothetical protein
MINEIVLLNNSIKRCGLKIKSKHPWITEHKREEGFIVGFDSKGQIATIEQCPSDKMAKMWKITPDKQKSFPVVNLKVPIWKLSSHPLEIHDALNDKDVAKGCDSMVKICEDSELAYKQPERNRLAGRLIDYPNELLEILDNTDSNLAGLIELINRLKSYKGNIDSFSTQLSQSAIRGYSDGSLQSIALVEKLLFGKWDQKEQIYKDKQGKTAITIPIVFDLDDYADFKYRIINPALGSYVSDFLLQKENISAEASTSRCAVTGEITPLETCTFPEPKIPVLGPTFLFSMNKDALCHQRYGKISSEIFPVSKKLTRELQNSLLYITDEKRKGKTWLTVPSSKKKQSDLLIVYLEDKPEIAISLAELLVENTESGNVEALFEETAASVCSALKGEPTLSLNSLLRLFVLTRLDPGRKQVVISSAFTVNSLISGADNWLLASKNHPYITILLPGKKGEKAKLLEPNCPTPASVMRCLQHQWIRNGTDSSAVPGCGLREVYDVFLGEQIEAKQSAKRLLQLCLKRLTPLLLGMGGALRTGELKPFKPHARLTALTTISLISILLFKLEHKKEEYMKKAAFNIGRMLALADTLHKEYCRYVRDNSIPPQLIGNALMATAIDNPERGLVRLRERLMIYKAWADKVNGEKYGLAKWALSQMGQVANELAGVDLPTRTDDAAKAQMLLGYLERSKKDNS